MFPLLLGLNLLVLALQLHRCRLQSAPSTRPTGQPAFHLLRPHALGLSRLLQRELVLVAVWVGQPPLHPSMFVAHRVEHPLATAARGRRPSHRRLPASCGARSWSTLRLGWLANLRSRPVPSLNQLLPLPHESLTRLSDLGSLMPAQLVHRCAHLGLVQRIDRHRALRKLCQRFSNRIIRLSGTIARRFELLVQDRQLLLQLCCFLRNDSRGDEQRAPPCGDSKGDTDSSRLLCRRSS